MTAQECYFDTGVFVTPLLKNRPQSVVDACLDWLRRVARGEVLAITSYLTWDEVSHVAGRAAGGVFDWVRAREAGRRLLDLTNLSFVPADGKVVEQAQSLLHRHKLKPRDSIHASSALLTADGRMVTLDFGFRTKVPSEVGLRLTELGP